MVGTVRAARHRDRAGAAFTAGLALGAAAIFVALGALGSVVSGRAVVVAAVALGVVAVASDALGLRVRPQIRFQVPEPWRRTMPLSRALFLYGLLLGTGLTTYVPATAAWALPALSLALGDVKASLAIAAGFAAGRALPVLAAARDRDRRAAAWPAAAAGARGGFAARRARRRPGAGGRHGRLARRRPERRGSRRRVAAAGRRRLPAPGRAPPRSCPETTPRSARPSSPGTRARR